MSTSRHRVLVGDVPTAAQEEVRTAFANVQAFFSERLDAGTADYTLYVAGDRESVAAVYRRSYGNEPSPDFCNGATASVVAIITLSCLESDPQYLERRHFDSIRERLAPWASLPQLSDGLDRRGPQRLLLATRARSAPTSGTRSLTHRKRSGPPDAGAVVQHFAIHCPPGERARHLRRRLCGRVLRSTSVELPRR